MTMIYLSVFYFVATTTVAFWSLNKVAKADRAITSLFIMSTICIVGSHIVMWDAYISYYLAETHNRDLLMIMFSVSIYVWLMFRVSTSTGKI